MALYSRAITICRSGAGGAHSKDPIVAALFSNRAACNFRLERYKAVIADCEAALAIDHLHVKSHVRLTKSLCEMGEFKKAEIHLRGTAAVEAATQGGTGAAQKAAAELRAARRTTEALCAVVERGLAALARGANAFAWRDSGGALRIVESELEWGPAHITGTGDFTIDSRARPDGRLSLRITDPDALADALVEAGIVPAENQDALRLAAMMAPRGPDGVSLPLRIHEGGIYLGPVRLGSLDG